MQYDLVCFAQTLLGVFYFFTIYSFDSLIFGFKPRRSRLALSRFLLHWPINLFTDLLIKLIDSRFQGSFLFPQTRN